MHLRRGTRSEGQMSDKIIRSLCVLDLIAFLAARRIPASIDELTEGVPAYGRAVPRMRMPLTR